MNICVIGTGYVGLVTGSVFADLGNDVICVDKLPQKVARLKQGRLPIYEPGLEEMVTRNGRDGRLVFTTDTADAVRRSDIVFICVNTPPKADGEADLAFVEEAARSIGEALNGYKVIVTKSTVPVGTGNRVREIIEDARQEEHDFDVVSNPEFLREGSAIRDTLYPDRIVIGAPNKQVAMTLLELYATFERPVFITDVKSAEIIKYASNAFLATKISFINSIADLCENVGADINMVSKAMGADRRIGGAFLQAGLGYGGSCFPKDVRALIHTTKRYGLTPTLLTSVSAVNQERASHFVARVTQALGGLTDRQLGVLGLSFKPDTDDMRDAKSVEVIELLLNEGARITAYDPQAMDHARSIFGGKITYAHNAYECAEGSDGLLLLTEWREFKSLNLERIKSCMAQPNLFDGRNLYDPERERRLGFRYFGIGVGPGEASN